MNDQIPEGFVGPSFEMDPTTDELLFDGEELRNGMIVINADFKVRNPAVQDLLMSMMAPVREEMKKIHGRWFQISRLRKAESMVMFIATYSDGIQRKQGHRIDQSWFVKKSTKEASVKRHKQIQNLVKDAMESWAADQVDGTQANFDTISENTAIAIAQTL